MADKKNIDELFKNKFEDLEAEAPAGSWEAIAGKLQRQKRKKRAAYWRWAGTAAAVVLAFFGGYYLQPGTDPGSYYDPRYFPVATEPVQKMEEPVQQRATPSENQELITNTTTTPSEKDLPREDSELPEVTSTSLVAQDFATRNKSVATPPQFKEDRERTEADKAAFADMEQVLLIPEDAAVAEAKPAEIEEFATEKAPDSQQMDSLRAVVANLPTNDEIGGEASSRRMPGAFSVGAQAGPALAFRNVDLKESSFNSNFSARSVVAENISREEVSNSFSAGVNFAFRGSGRLEYLTGIYLTRWQQQASELVVNPNVAGAPSNSVAGIESSSSLGNMSYLNNAQPGDFFAIVALDSSTMAYELQPDVEQEFNFIEIPLGVNYYLVDQQKWSWTVQGGASARILAGARSQFVYDDGRETEIDNPQLNKLSLQLQAGTGVGYRLTNDLQFNLMPLLKYGVTPVNDNSQVTTYFHQVMIYSGLSFQF